MFRHHDDVWRDFPGLAAGALLVAAPLDPGSAAADIARVTAAPAGALGAGRVSVLTREAPRFTI